MICPVDAGIAFVIDVSFMSYSSDLCLDPAHFQVDFESPF